ncbi:thioredoxin-dependent thiol peroxidase [Candidatus Acetothermia bacterium]|nr:thioredoxin-dependent thiol peroxidase [Candidatus Acetothermia bacterium]MBI3642479.1 thioredoxin-dependent thiol peroxidase [Candidatus Acetothermia bacterium]
MLTLKAGDIAPDFSLADQSGKMHKLSAYRGQWVLIFFYPKDDTPGCTKEACGLRDNFAELKRLNTAIFGISIDSIESHKSFAEKYKLPYTLLADETKAVVNKYGVWGKKEYMGKEYEGTSRVSFLIDPTGKIAKIYEKVNPEEHAAEVIRDRSK